LNCAISPTPLTAYTEIHVALDGNPVCAVRKRSRNGERDHEIKIVGRGVGQVGRAVNQGTRKGATILVDENVERIRWTKSIEICTQHINFGDIPCLASGHDEIVGSKVIKCVKIRFEVLRTGAGGPLVVVLIVEHYLWSFGRRQNTERTSLGRAARSSGLARRQAGANIVRKKLRL
jgi:hypothetical protein